ncbi:hypothetical protein PQR64_30800 [Paraburkholderia phytofirmans]|uniref:hypothetical protein n=1 Tax=Paraburkholderia phytofirmans TaxID=261302 RepID=UPI0038BC16E7
MELKELMEAIEIEGAERGDVVFIEVAPDMSYQDFTRFSESFRTHANSIRSEGFFPRCIILPPGVKAEVARAQAQDRIEIQPAPLDAGFPHG